MDSSDNNVYFVKAGHMQMRAMDKLLAGRESQGTTVAQAAAAAPTMAATGPLSKVSTVTVVQQDLCKVSVVNSPAGPTMAAPGPLPTLVCC